MILLEDTNTLIQQELSRRLGKPAFLDQLFVDFDGVTYHLSTPEKGNRGVTYLSMGMRAPCWEELVANGALDLLMREYGEALQGEVEGQTIRSDGGAFSWDVTLKFDLGQEGLGALPEEEGLEMVRKLSMLKR